MEAEGVSHKKEKERREKHFAIFGKWEEEKAQPHCTGQQKGCAKKQRRSSDNACSAAD